MSKLFTWFCANRLSLNPTKTKYIVIKAPKHKIDIEVKLQQIGNKSKEKSTTFLGVHFDDD